MRGDERREGGVESEREGAFRANARAFIRIPS